MPAKYNPPSVHRVSFNCPHCGAMAHQTWFSCYAKNLGKDNLPRVEFSSTEMEAFGPPESIPEKFQTIIARLNASEVFFDEDSDALYGANRVNNVAFSHCYSCNKVAVWRHKSILYPAPSLGIEANVDMPDEIRLDFDEARAIFFDSPRGSAALLRLAVQKLCVFLGEKGSNINDDIASLVKKGLPGQVQQALD